MQARCPHCSNVFNTERAGIQFCPNCGQQINVPDPAGAGGPATGAGPGAGPGSGMLPPPPPGSPGAVPGMARGPVPWEERSQRGVLRAFFENTKAILLGPEEFWQRMRPDGPLGDGLFYGWICYAITAVLSLPFALLTRGYNQAQMEQAMENLKNLPPEFQRTFESLMQLVMQLATGKGTVVSMLGGVIIYPVILIISAAILHLFCLVCGAAKNGFNATVRVVAYSRATYLVSWIPVCGPLVAAVWGIVLTIWGIARAQDTTVARAVVAVLVIPFVLSCCCMGALVFAIAGMAGAASKMQ